MSKIDLKAIFKAYALNENELAGLEKIWDLAVDECKKAAKTKSSYYQDNSGNDGFNYYVVDEDSIEKVKQMIR